MNLTLKWDIFINNFVISLIQDNVIHSLVNNKYLKIYKNKTEEIAIKNSEQLEKILKNDLNLEFTTKEIAFFYAAFFP